MTRIFAAAGLCLLTFASPVSGEVLPEQVAVVANIQQPNSLRLARHYLATRRIPPNHLIRVSTADTETVTRELYEKELVLPIREQLTRQGLAQTIRVLVTTHGIPLRVSPPKVGDVDKQVILDARAKQGFARQALLQTVEFSAKVAPIEEGPAGPTLENLPENRQEADKVLILRAREALSAAAKRIKKLDSQEQKREEIKKLSSIVLRYGGLTALARNVDPNKDDASQQVDAAHTRIVKEIAASQQLLRVINQTPSEENRKRAYAVIQRIYGAVGVLSQATKEIQTRQHQATDASVDSELSLLWWDRNMYSLPGRLPNPLFHAFSSRLKEAPNLLPVVMVSRIDAPTAEQAISMINRAVRTEKTGLKGKVYIDARGLDAQQGTLFSQWDQNLRDLAWLLRRTTSYQVYLDDYKTLLDKAPETALYVGWYQLRNYQDVFDFSEGAIGYHIASEEAVSIRNPEEKGWCKNMLERGITVTLGAVAEPYVDAFPLPQQFFGMLLSGSYSLVEVYYLTIPYISWRMVLFGDPLYNPWRGQKLVSFEDLMLRSTRDQKLTGFPTPPAQLPFHDPVALRKKIENDRKNLRKQVDKFFERLEQQIQPPRPQGGVA